jgi:hypothetical protein
VVFRSNLRTLPLRGEDVQFRLWFNHYSRYTHSGRWGGVTLVKLCELMKEFGAGCRALRE